MERHELNEEVLDGISGGSIIFSPDHTTVGRNCNNQYAVNNYSAIVQFYANNVNKMPEKQMMQEMLSLGYISPL